jgi:P27 family predicted phage terminase small subunit
VPVPAKKAPAKKRVAKKTVSQEVVIVEEFPPPENLPVAVHSVWRNAVADLGGANHMRDPFTPTLYAYCQAVYIHAQVSANIEEFGVLVSGANGPMKNPLLAVQKDAAATMLRFADSLGLTPSGRIRLGLMEVTGMSLLASLNQSIDGGS